MNFLMQSMPPSTDYMLYFPGFKETWCDMTSYEVPNVIAVSYTHLTLPTIYSV